MLASQWPAHFRTVAGSDFNSLGFAARDGLVLSFAACGVALGLGFLLPTALGVGILALVIISPAIMIIATPFGAIAALGGAMGLTLGAYFFRRTRVADLIASTTLGAASAVLVVSSALLGPTETRVLIFETSALAVVTATTTAGGCAFAMLFAAALYRYHRPTEGNRILI